MARLASFFNVLEEANRADRRVLRNMQRMSRYNSQAIQMDNITFRQNYRLSKELFHVLVEELTPHMSKLCPRRGDISIKCKILVALSFYGTGSYQRIVGRSVGTVMSQQSVSKAIREVTDALNQRDILCKYIKFPQSAEERNSIKRKFYEKFGIPGVLGCIDGTHVAIIRPSQHEHEERFFNRKHYHSRNVQIICDSEMNILSADATFGGATHDSFIFNQHPIKSHLINLERSGETAYFLGDSGYAQRFYMMTPIINAVAGSPEEYYTMQHCSARNTVERTIGLLKARWRCLLRHRVLHYKPRTATKIINACCVLHNLCNRANCTVPDDADTIDSTETYHPTFEVVEQTSYSDELRRGQTARRTLAQMMWQQRNRRL